ncbi:MAG: A/G-specific adenine glycosylase [Coriobacteriia bacterium]|nr:A/G-specific adenine glycosylase [Coriobacteriia bacterium]
MLQQTQVARVVPYYEEWMDRFPTPDALAAAPLEAVLRTWQGLGYNRRAVALVRAADDIVSVHGGAVPRDRDALLALPGVGPATAAGVRAFAFGEPDLYLETNVRTVLLHEFFADAEGVPDTALLPLLEQTLDRDDPRTWYWALLDYGAHLKRTLPNPSRRSRHHARQAPFEGSHRQLRARLLRAVMELPGSTADELAAGFDEDVARAGDALAELVEEGFLAEERGRYRVR